MNPADGSPALRKDNRNRLIREEIPVTGIRKVIGKRMKTSLDSMPQGGVTAKTLNRILHNNQN